LRSIKLMKKSFKPGKPIRTEELKGVGRSKAMLAGIMALNPERGTLCLAAENRAVGGKSKSGAMTITSTTAINTKPTNLAQRFIIQLAIFYVPLHLVCQIQKSWPAWLACVRWPLFMPTIRTATPFERRRRMVPTSDFTMMLRSWLEHEDLVTNHHLADLEHQVLLSFPWPTLLSRAMPIGPISEAYRP
jgi:hypothetical protein